MDKELVQTDLVITLLIKEISGQANKKPAWYTSLFREKKAIYDFTSNLSSQNIEWFVDNYPVVARDQVEASRLVEIYQKIFSGDFNFKHSFCLNGNKVMFWGDDKTKYLPTIVSGDDYKVAFNNEFNQLSAMQYAIYENGERFSGDTDGWLVIPLMSSWGSYGELAFKGESLNGHHSQLESENIKTVLANSESLTSSLSDPSISNYSDYLTEMSIDKLKGFMDQATDEALDSFRRAMLARENIAAIDGGAVVLLFYKDSARGVVDYEYWYKSSDNGGFKIANYYRRPILDSIISDNVEPILRKIRVAD
ncbi:MAG: hypothetical protein KUG81_01240 [Gammaproteobacteria bacterium]|nr:hypothetical protein [Gammaproteobacteria bacterium]